VDVKTLLSMKIFVWYWVRVLVNLISSTICVGLVIGAFEAG
jgi:hypothetical protein